MSQQDITDYSCPECGEPPKGDEWGRLFCLNDDCMMIHWMTQDHKPPWEEDTILTVGGHELCLSVGKFVCRNCGKRTSFETLEEQMAFLEAYEETPCV